MGLEILQGLCDVPQRRVFFSDFSDGLKLVARWCYLGRDEMDCLSSSILFWTLSRSCCAEYRACVSRQ